MAVAHWPQTASGVGLRNRKRGSELLALLLRYALRVLCQSIDDLPIFPIQTAARLTGVNARRLRGWESQHGLIEAARKRRANRLFSQRNLEVITRINHFRLRAVERIGPLRPSG